MRLHTNVKTTQNSAGEKNADLPREYKRTRLVVMPRNSQWMYAYWEIAPYTWEDVKHHFGTEVQFEGHPILRFYSENMGLRDTFDVPVRLDERCWHVLSPEKGRAWRADLGILLANGYFIILAISNPIQLSTGRTMTDQEVEGGVSESEWDSTFDIKGGWERHKRSLGVAKMLARMWNLIKSLSLFWVSRDHQAEESCLCHRGEHND